MLARAIVSFMVAFVAIGCAKEDAEKLQLPDETEQETVSEQVIEKGRLVQSRGWMEPVYTEAEVAAVMKNYEHLDPHGLIPKNLLQKTMLYFHQNISLINNKDKVAIVDFSKHSRKERFFIVELDSGQVSVLHVSHGKGSDPSNSGYATKFSNVVSTGMSSLGHYVTGETYVGKHGYSRRLDGLSKTNSLVRERAVVIHGAKYVSDNDVRQGRSLGCLAFSMANRRYVIDELIEGTLIYAGRSRYD